jgi:hypothetical protein
MPPRCPQRGHRARMFVNGGRSAASTGALVMGAHATAEPRGRRRRRARSMLAASRGGNHEHRGADARWRNPLDQRGGARPSRVQAWRAAASLDGPEHHVPQLHALGRRGPRCRPRGAASPGRRAPGERARAGEPRASRTGPSPLPPAPYGRRRARHRGGAPPPRRSQPLSSNGGRSALARYAPPRDRRRLAHDGRCPAGPRLPPAGDGLALPRRRAPAGLAAGGEPRGYLATSDLALLLDNVANTISSTATATP